MRISLFCHDANPSVDAPLCHKSKSYIATEVAAGRAWMIDARRAQLFAPKASGPPPKSSKFGAIRDDSVSPGERIVFAYCYGNAKADQTLSDKEQKAAFGAHLRAKALIDGVRADRRSKLPAIVGWIRPTHNQECSL